VIPPTWPTEARGEATFVETPEDFAGVDLAFMGKDTAQMAIGRWGKASGYRDQFGKFIKFKNRLNITEDKPRYVLQIDQIIPLSKHDNVITMSEEIMGKARSLGLKPENIALDATGMGFGVSGHLRKVFGEIISVAWNEKATESKITADDLDGADKQCDGVMSEMWWAFRRWLDPSCRAILINPIIPSQPLQTQLTARRYKPATTKGIKVEKKEDYMARNAQGSPDEVDACFVAGTMVLTPSGSRPIETIRVGDPVVTPLGISNVAIVHVTECSRPTELRCSNGSVLVGKGAHKVFTWNRGWVRMDGLVLTDHLEPDTSIGLWNIHNTLFTTEESIGFKQLVSTIKTGTKLRRSDFYIELSGRSILARYLKVCTSITKMVIGLITPKITWSLRRLRSIASFTCQSLCPIRFSELKLKSGDCEPLRRPRSGTDPQMDGRGTENTESKLGRQENQDLQRVSCAESNMSLLPQRETGHVQNIAKVSAAEPSLKKRFVYVLFAALSSTLKLLSRRKLVPESVQQICVGESVKTYNLTLNNHNAYYANGILVDNCMMLLHAVRLRSKILPGLVEQQDTKQSVNDKAEIKFTPVKKMMGSDAEDSLCASGSDEY